MGHELIIRILAVAVEVENGLTFVLEFLDILPDASIRLIKFLVAILPRIEYDGFEQLFVLRVRFDGLQELNEFLFEYNLLNGLGVRALLAAMVIVRMVLASPTTSKASGQWLIAMLTNDEPPQWESGIVERTGFAFEMKSAFHALALGE